MNHRAASEPNYFFKLIYQFLHLKKLTLDSFLRSLKLSNPNKITVKQFAGLVRKLMGTLDIEALSSSNLFLMLKGKDQLIDVASFKDRYLDISVREKSFSISRDKRSSFTSRIYNSIDRITFSREKDGDMNRAEMGLDYLITSQAVKEKLKKCLLGKMNHKRTILEGVNAFLTYCNLKELKISSIKEKIAEKMYLIVAEQLMEKPERKFYSELLKIIKFLREKALISGQISNISRSKKADFIQVSIKKGGSLRKTMFPLSTDTENLTNRFNYFNQSLFQLNEQINRASVDSFEKYSAKEQHLTSRSSERRDIHGKNKHQTQLCSPGIVNKFLSQNICDFQESQQQLNDENQRIIEEQKNKQHQQRKRRQIDQKRAQLVQLKCQRMIEKFHKNRSIDSSSSNVRKRPLCKRLYNQFIQNPSNIFSPAESNRKQRQQDQISYSFKETDRSSYKKLYPLASKYYRFKRNPTEKQLPFFAQLDQLLRREAIFTDQYNPACRYDYMRANRLFNSPTYFLIKGDYSKLSGNRVRQESTDSNHFMAVLASLADKYQQLISEIFLFGANPARYYCVKVFIDGQQRIIKTDDQFPSKLKKPVYSSPPINEIWTMLIEKVYAKVLKGYDNIVSGSLYEVFFLLTGVGGREKAILEERSLLQLIKAKENGNLMVAETKNVVSKARQALFLTKGLQTCPYQSVLDVDQFGEGLVVIKARNPQGSNYYTKKGAHESVQLAKVLSESVSQIRNNLQNGCFYMTQVELKKYFSKVFISNYSPFYKLSSCQLDQTSKNSKFYNVYLKIVKKGYYFISVIFPSVKKVRLNYLNNISFISLGVLSKDAKQSNSILISCPFSEQMPDCQVYQAELCLQSGNHSIQLRLNQERQLSKNIRLTCYGPSLGEFTKIQ